MSKPAIGLRKPPPVVVPLEADAFVSGASVQASNPPSTQTPERPEPQTSERSNAKAPKPPNAQTSKRSGAQRSKRPDVQTSRPKSIVTRTDGRELRRMTVYLPPDLAKRLAVRCVEMDREMSDAVAEAVDAWLKG